MSKKGEVEKQPLPFTPFMNPLMLTKWIEQMATNPSKPANTKKQSGNLNHSESSDVMHLQQNLQLPKKRKSSHQSAAARKKIFKNAYTKKIIASYPNIKITDSIAFLENEECMKCNIYIGRFALAPCGHAKYCMKCIDELKTTSVKTNVPGRCLSKTCLSIVRSWFLLNKIEN